MAKPVCPGCWKTQDDAPDSIDETWWCVRCLNGRVAKAVVFALIYDEREESTLEHHV